MGTRAIYHTAVTAALIVDGWTITHDPYPHAYGGEDAVVDLVAEHAGRDAVLAAERGTTTIAVEIATFTGLSMLTDVQRAIGQYSFYRSWMRRADPNRLLYLAVDEEAAANVFAHAFGRVVADDLQMRLLIVALDAERISAWKHVPTSNR